jgi:hypothetical protein
MITRRRRKKHGEKLVPLRLGPPRISTCSHTGLNPVLCVEKSGPNRMTVVTLFIIIQILCFWTLSIVFVYRHLYFSKHNVSETGFCLRLQVKSAQLGPIDRASPCLRTPVTPVEGQMVCAVFMYPILELAQVSGDKD